jgi:hypothetical protein
MLRYPIFHTYDCRANKTVKHCTVEVAAGKQETRNIPVRGGA